MVSARTRPLAVACVLALASGAAQPVRGATPAGEEREAGAVGGPGLAILTAKALTAELDGRQFVDHAVILVKDGKIEAVGPRDSTEVPAGYEVLDVGRLWVAPGMIELHGHVGGGPPRDINDMVYQVNPGLRASAAVVPRNSMLEPAVAGGVTTLLFIPGSGTNIGGQGVLIKTAHDTYEEMLVRAPGSLKIAQGDNPTRWGYGMGRLLMNFHIRSSLREGLAYARRWEAFERGEAERPERDLRLDVFRDLYRHSTQISTHTQYYQLVLTSITMLAGEFGLDVYIDHGSFDSYLTAELALEHNVAAILGPREVLWPRPPRYDTDGQVHGSAWGFQQRGLKLIGFNTDAVSRRSASLAQEELSVQAAMGVRYGFDDSNMEGLRGITIVPAVVAGLGHRVGSIEPGKDADLLVTTGDPVDPRTSIERVFVDGVRVYDTTRDRRRW